MGEFLQDKGPKFQSIKNIGNRDFPGGPVVKNLPCNAGDAGLIPGWGTKILGKEKKIKLKLKKKKRIP